MYTVLLNRELFLHLVLFLDLKVNSLFPTKKQNLKATWFTVSNTVAKNNCISQTFRHLKTIIKEHVPKCALELIKSLLKTISVALLNPMNR